MSWLKLSSTNNPYQDLLWGRPEKTSQRGSLVLVCFDSKYLPDTNHLMEQLLLQKPNTLTVILPDKLARIIPAAAGFIFCPSTPSGSLAATSEEPVSAAVKAHDVVVVAGGVGSNQETQLLAKKLANNHPNSKWVTTSWEDFYKNSQAEFIYFEDSKKESDTEGKRSVDLFAKENANATYVSPLNNTIAVAHKDHAVQLETNTTISDALVVCAELLAETSKPFESAVLSFLTN